MVIYENVIVLLGKYTLDYLGERIPRLQITLKWFRGGNGVYILRGKHKKYSYGVKVFKKS